MNVITFTHNEFGDIRTMMDENGSPWFVACDVTHALGYKQGAKALQRHVAKEDRGSVVIHDFVKHDEEVDVINVAGLFSLILSSKKEDAKAFKRWVTSEVLPQMKWTSGKQNAMIKKLSAEDIALQGKKIMGHSVAVANEESKGCLTASEVARRWGVDVRSFNKMVEEMKIQYRKNGRWHIDKALEKMGLTCDRVYAGFTKDGEYKEHTYMTWTPKGVRYLEEVAHRPSRA